MSEREPNERELNELLSAIVHQASQGMLHESVEYKQKSLDMISAAIASAVPTEKVTSFHPMLPPTLPPGADGVSEGETNRKRGDFLTMPNGAHFVRFATKDRVELVAKNSRSNPNERHVYKICVYRDYGKWAVQATIDCRQIFGIVQVNSRGRAEKMAVSAFHKYLKINRHGRKSANA